MIKDAKKNGLLTEVNFDETSIVFSPPESDFHQFFEKILSDMLFVVSDINPVARVTTFNQYTQGIISDQGPRFKFMIEESESYSELRENITHQI